MVGIRFGGSRDELLTSCITTPPLIIYIISFLLGKWSTLNKGNYVQCIWTFVEWVNTRMNESLKFDFCRKPMLINIGRPTVVVVTVWWHLGGRLNTPLWGKFGDLMVAPTWRACWGHKQEFGREWQPTPQTPNWATGWTETGMPWSIWQKRVANGSTPGDKRISTLKSSAFDTLCKRKKNKLSKMQVRILEYGQWMKHAPTSYRVSQN